MCWRKFHLSKPSISCCTVLRQLRLIPNDFQRGAVAPRDMKRDMATLAPPEIAGLQSKGVAVEVTQPKKRPPQI
jgi:hypothetical protein